MNIPLITVVTVVRNGAATLEQTMLSVLNQTYPRIEYIIVDGASTDGTVEIIKKYETRINEFPNVSFRWISEPDTGIYDAMNKGIDMATGEWINFMNSGDWFYNSNVLKDVFHCNTISDKIDIIYGDVLIFSELGEIISRSLPLNNITKQMCFSHQSAFVRSLFMKDKKFDTAFKSSGDYHFFYNAYMQNRMFCYIPLLISRYYWDEGMSRNSIITWKEDAYIWGIAHTTKWKAYFVKRIIIREIKIVIKLLLPNNVVYKIRKKNFIKLFQ